MCLNPERSLSYFARLDYLLDVFQKYTQTHIHTRMHIHTRARACTHARAHARTLETHKHTDTRPLFEPLVHCLCISIMIRAYLVVRRQPLPCDLLETERRRREIPCDGLELFDNFGGGTRTT